MNLNEQEVAGATIRLEGCPLATVNRVRPPSPRQKLRFPLSRFFAFLNFVSGYTSETKEHEAGILLLLSVLVAYHEGDRTFGASEQTKKCNS